MDRLGASRVAVLHADGNGVGQVFVGFAELARRLGVSAASDYLDLLRRFSLGLDVATVSAFGSAVDAVTLDGAPPPLFPIVVGGDDVTAVLDAAIARDFTRTFLLTFERLTTLSAGMLDSDAVETVRKAYGDQATAALDSLRVVHRVAGAAFPAGQRLGAAAGLAIVQPKYPFHAAYRLAEDLMRSAKQVKAMVRTSAGDTVPTCALDLHLVDDSSYSDLDLIDQRLTVAGRVLRGGPYVVSDIDGLLGLAPDAQTWVEAHHASRLDEMVRMVSATESGPPRSQFYALRETLTRGGAAVSRQLAVLARYPGLPSVADLRQLLDVEDAVGRVRPCRLVDALDLADIEAPT